MITRFFSLVTTLIVSSVSVLIVYCLLQDVYSLSKIIIMGRHNLPVIVRDVCIVTIVLQSFFIIKKFGVDTFFLNLIYFLHPFFLIGVAGVIVASVILLQKHDLLLHGVKVQGVIVRSSILDPSNKFPSRTTATLPPLAAISKNGVDTVIVSCGHSDVYGVSKGDTVEVIYLPDDYYGYLKKDQVGVNRFVDLWLHSFSVFLLSFMCVIFYYCRVYK